MIRKHVVKLQVQETRFLPRSGRATNLPGIALRMRTGSLPDQPFVRHYGQQQAVISIGGNVPTIFLSENGADGLGPGKRHGSGRSIHNDWLIPILQAEGYLRRVTLWVFMFQGNQETIFPWV